VSIAVPEIPPSLSDEEIHRNPALMKSLNDAVTEWTQKIRELAEEETKRAQDRVHDTSSGETEFW